MGVGNGSIASLICVAAPFSVTLMLLVQSLKHVTFVIGLQFSLSLRLCLCQPLNSNQYQNIYWRFLMFVFLFAMDSRLDLDTRDESLA